MGIPGGKKAGLGALPVVFGCVSRATNRLLGMPVRVLRGDGSELSRLPNWLRNPNPETTWTSLISRMVISLWIQGNVYIVPIRDGSGRIGSLLFPDPRVVDPRVRPDGNVEYYVNGQRWEGEILHQRYMTLPGEVKGMSAIKAGLMAVDIGLSSQAFSSRFFRNGTMISTVYSTKDELTETQAKILLAQIKAGHTGHRNAFKPIVAGGGLTPHGLSQTMEQSEFMAISQWSASQISSMCFGIDPTLMGIQQPGSQLTYSNTPGRERQLWLDALNPLMVRIEEVISKLLTGRQVLDFKEQELLLGGLSDRSQVARNLALINKDHGYFVILADEIRDLVGLLPHTGPLEPLAGKQVTPPQIPDQAPVEDD